MQKRIYILYPIALNIWTPLGKVYHIYIIFLLMRWWIKSIENEINEFKIEKRMKMFILCYNIGVTNKH